MQITKVNPKLPKSSKTICLCGRVISGNKRYCMECISKALKDKGKE